MYREDDVLELVELGRYGSFPLRGLNPVPGQRNPIASIEDREDSGMILELVTGGIEMIKKSA